jgi:hypothetical protein
MAVEFLWNAAFWKTSGGIRDLPKEEVVRVLGGSVAAWPLAARAQQPAMPVVGLYRARVSRRYAVHGGLACVGSANGDCPRHELATEVRLRNSVHATQVEVGHASGSNCVRAGDCVVWGGIWRHFVTKSLHSGAGVRATPGNIHREPGSDGCG